MSKRQRLPKGKRQEIEQLAATLWLLPTKLRYRFFSAFHDDLRRFFSEEEREVAGDGTVTVGISGAITKCSPQRGWWGASSFSLGQSSHSNCCWGDRYPILRKMSMKAAPPSRLKGGSTNPNR